MRRALATTSVLLFVLSLLAACARGEQRALRKASDAGLHHARASAPSHYLNEWFSLGATRCRLQRVERALTEPSHPEPRRVAADIFVVAAQLACEDDAQQAVPVATALKAVQSVAWLDDRRERHPPASDTLLNAQLSAEHLLFEVPAHDEGLLFPRSYDASSGDPLGLRERGRARLLLELPGQLIAVAPWPRGHDRALDLLLDRLARTLATAAPFETLSETPEAHEAIQTAAALYGRALARLAPKQLTVRALDTERKAPWVTLSLEQSSAVTLVSFTFELTTDSGRPSVARLVNEAEARAAIECGETKSELAQRALAARKQAPERELCNALATLLPGPCNEADRALLETALEVGTRCTPFAALHQGEPLPSDFAMRLERGRSSTSFDPTPRYTLSVERSGRVSFRGAPWLSERAASEGRTSSTLMALLHAEIMRLHFFERPLREGSPCKASDERGDLLTVRAGGRERSVRDRDGCRGPFAREELAQLRQTLEQVTAVAAWTTPNANPKERDPDIWIVAAE